MAKKTIGELSVLLGMDTEVYQKNMKKSKSDLQGFGDSAKNIALKFTAAFAAVAGAVKSAEVVIQATQFTADSFEMTVAGLKAGVDSFFIAVSSGDWTNFREGLSKSISTARELASELDALGDVRRGLSIQATELEGKQYELLEKMKDRTGKYSIDQQKKYFEEYTSNQEVYNAKILDAANRERDAILNSYSAITGLENVQIYQVLKNFGDNYERRFNDAAAKLTKASDSWGQLHDIAKEGNFFDKTNFEAYLSTLNETDKFYVQLYRHFGKLNDAKLDKAVPAIKAVGEALNANSKFAVENMRLYNQLFKADKPTKAPVIIPEMENLMPKSWSNIMPTTGSLPMAKIVSSSMDGLYDSVKESSDKIIQTFDRFKQDMNSSINTFVTDMVTSLAAGFGEAMVTGDWDNFGASILDGFGKFAQQFGGLLIAYGIAQKVLINPSIEPFSKIAAGVALVALGAALSAAAGSAKNIGSGGSVSPVSSSMSSSSYSSGNSDRTYRLEWKRAGKDLYALFKEESNSINTLTGRR